MSPEEIISLHHLFSRRLYFLNTDHPIHPFHTWAAAHQDFSAGSEMHLAWNTISGFNSDFPYFKSFTLVESKTTRPGMEPPDLVVDLFCRLIPNDVPVLFF